MACSSGCVPPPGAILRQLPRFHKCAGVSVHFGAASQISADGQTAAVASAAFANQLWKYVYMYKRDPATDRFRIVSSISGGEAYTDPWPLASDLGVNVDNALSLSQSGRFVLRVEGPMLVVYEATGSGAEWSWLRRCQIPAPQGYLFRASVCPAANALQLCCACSSRCACTDNMSLLPAKTDSAAWHMLIHCRLWCAQHCGDDTIACKVCSWGLRG